MSQRRPRSVASPLLGIAEYTEIIKDWADASSMTMDAQAGTLVTEQRMVTPSIVVRMSEFLAGLIRVGCFNAALYPSKFEQATKIVVSENPKLLDRSKNLDVFSFDFATHCRLVCGTLR